MHGFEFDGLRFGPDRIRDPGWGWGWDVRVLVEELWRAGGGG